MRINVRRTLSYDNLHKIALMQLKKTITKICVIVLCLYAMLLLRSVITPEETIDKPKKEGFTSSTIKAVVQFLTTSLPEMTQEHLENIQNFDFMEELKQRRVKVQKTCTQIPHYSKDLLRLIYKDVLRNLFVDEKHNLTWCPIFKAASTTFMELYAEMGGALNETLQKQLKMKRMNIQDIARIAFPKAKGKSNYKVIHSSNRLLVVRHPFSRLLSAYRDKLEHQENRKFYYEKYGKKIVRAFGNPGKQVEPTFVDFLKSVARRYLFDEHWRPYYKECAPCLLDYNIILKTESLNMELKQLYPKFGIPVNLLNTSINVNPKGQTDWQIIKKYYSKVPRQLLESVYNIYKTDFLMFNYSPEPYFKLTQITTNNTYR